MTGEADTGAGPFGAAYSSAFEAYLIERDETRLRAAYELGRDAVTRRLTVLDLAVAHHEALQSAFVEGADSAEMRSLVRAGGEFFLESLSAFEMVQRGFAEAREAALLERRQTDLARGLSTFLADASLALDGSSSLEEMLRLVAEQARELVDAGCCVATSDSRRRRELCRPPPTRRVRRIGPPSLDGSTFRPSTRPFARGAAR